MTIIKQTTDERTGVGDLFEQAFSRNPIESRIAACNQHELRPLFEQYLPGHTPILEAGCGSGCWAIWFQRRGWDCIGTDWSASLCAAAARAEPRAGFVAGDLRKLPFENSHFGAIVSLGSIEHVREGPMRILDEFHRVLRPQGRLIVTVPHLGALRRISRSIKNVLAPIRYRIRPNPEVRTMRSYLPPPQGTGSARWAADFHLTPSGDSFFYQYYLTPRQLRTVLERSGFSIDRIWVEFGDEGVLHHFGSLAGYYDYENQRVVFNWFGRFLRRVLKLRFHGHMIVALAHKS